MLPKPVLRGSAGMAKHVESPPEIEPRGAMVHVKFGKGKRYVFPLHIFLAHSAQSQRVAREISARQQCKVVKFERR